MKKIICFLFGHDWAYFFPDRIFCKRCSKRPIGEEYKTASKRIANKLN